MSKEKKKKASNKSIGENTRYLIRLETVRNEYQILRDQLTFHGVTDEIEAKILAQIDQHEKEMLDYVVQAAANRNNDNEPLSEGGGDNEPPSKDNAILHEEEMLDYINQADKRNSDNEPPSESGNDNEPSSKDKQSNIKRSKPTKQSYTVTPRSPIHEIDKFVDQVTSVDKPATEETNLSKIDWKALQKDSILLSRYLPDRYRVGLHPIPGVDDHIILLKPPPCTAIQLLDPPIARRMLHYLEVARSAKLYDDPVVGHDHEIEPEYGKSDAPDYGYDSYESDPDDDNDAYAEFAECSNGHDQLHDYYDSYESDPDDDNDAHAEFVECGTGHDQFRDYDTSGFYAEYLCCEPEEGTTVGLDPYDAGPNDYGDDRILSAEADVNLSKFLGRSHNSGPWGYDPLYYFQNY